MADEIWYRIFLCLGFIFGGTIAREVYMQGINKIRKVELISGLLVSGFIGALVVVVTMHFSFDPLLGGIVAGALGWIGPQLFDDILRKVVKKETAAHDIEIEEEEEDNGK